MQSAAGPGFACPHCGEAGISTLRKLSLGPALPAVCTRCGRKVGVPYAALLGIAPLLSVPLALELLESLWGAGGCLIASLLASSAIHLYWVPLQRR